MRLNNNFAWDLGLSRLYLHATAAWYWNRFISPVFLSSFLEGLAKRIRIYFHSCFQFNLNHLHPPKFAPTLEFIAPALMLRKCKLKTDKLKVISVRYTENLITYLKCHANCKWRYRKLNYLPISKSGHRITEIFWAVKVNFSVHQNPSNNTIAG